MTRECQCGHIKGQHPNGGTCTRCNCPGFFDAKTGTGLEWLFPVALVIAAIAVVISWILLEWKQ